MRAFGQLTDRISAIYDNVANGGNRWIDPERRETPDLCMNPGTEFSSPRKADFQTLVSLVTMIASDGHIRRASFMDTTSRSAVAGFCAFVVCVVGLARCSSKPAAPPPPEDLKPIVSIKELMGTSSTR